MNVVDGGQRAAMADGGRRMADGVCEILRGKSERCVNEMEYNVQMLSTLFTISVDFLFDLK